jgi:hypothetical protein
MDRQFVGDAFEDSLLNTDNNSREMACAWRIQSSLPRFSPLTNGSWLWRAVGIPLSLVDRSLEGDIDLMFAVRGQPRRCDGRMVFPPPLYRCFELKTAKVSRSGEMKSLKEGKFYKTKAQLQKLCNLGAPQVFLLEAFIVEAGFTVGGTFAMPPRVRVSVAAKYDQIVGADFGYVALALEQIPGYSEAGAGLLWPVTTIKPATVQPMRAPFGDIVSELEAYAKRTKRTRSGFSVLSYCYDCKGLTWAPHRGPYLCATCGAPLL